MNMSRTTHVIVLLVVLALAFAGGVLATGREIAPLPLGEVTRGTDLSELSQCLSALREEIALLRKDLDGREQATCTSQGRQAIETPLSDPQALERFALAIERALSKQATGAGGSPADTVEAGPLSLSEEERSRRSANLADLRKQAPDARLPAHFLCTPRQIVEQYGVPDSVYSSPEGELNFIYQRSEAEPQLQFGFANGALVRLMGE
jgi:hypothetical protein